MHILPSFDREPYSTSVCTQSSVSSIIEVQQVWVYQKSITVVRGILLYNEIWCLI